MSPLGSIRDLQRSVASASGRKMVQVVKMVDAMVDRGSANNLLTPIRTTQAHLMPARPLRFSRLLFLPLDPIIVQASRWRPGGVRVPRTAIAPIATAVRDALGGAAGIEAMIAGHNVGETQVDAKAGNLLWPQAGRIVADMAACPDWVTKTGLSIQAWLEIRTTVSGVLLVADRVWGKDAPGLASSSTITALIGEAQQRTPQALNAVVAVLLAPSEASARILMAASRHSDHLAALSSQAVSRTLDDLSNALKSRVAGASLEDAAEEAETIGTFLRGVELSGTASEARIRSARRDAALECMDRFRHGIADELFAPMRGTTGPRSDAAIMAIEGVARSLRQLELASRHLGVDAGFDRPLNEAWATLCQPGLDLAAVDRARIGEILFGPDRAESLVPAGSI